MWGESLAVARNFRTRGQIAFSILLLVCIAQTVYWTTDQVSFAVHVLDSQERAYARDVEQVRRLLARGDETLEWIQDSFPQVRVLDSGAVEMDPEVLRAARDELSGRVNRVAWEGGFFLLILAAGILILMRAVRQRHQLRKQEENFLSAVSHELKSPLASIRLTTESLLMRDPEKDKREVKLKRILDDLNRLQDMVTNILETNLLDEGGVRTEAMPLELNESVREVVEEFEPAMEERHTAIHQTLAPGLRVHVDPTALRTILRNLLENARKATASRKDARIEIKADCADGDVRLRVSDNGVGFEPKDAARIFEKFFRVGDEMRRTSQGCGLGLYIVKRFAQLDGGKVKAQSKGPGFGAEFQVSWPIARENPV